MNYSREGFARSSPAAAASVTRQRIFFPGGAGGWPATRNATDWYKAHMRRRAQAVSTAVAGQAAPWREPTLTDPKIARSLDHHAGPIYATRKAAATDSESNTRAQLNLPFLNCACCPCAEGMPISSASFRLHGISAEHPHREHCVGRRAALSWSDEPAPEIP